MDLYEICLFCDHFVERNDILSVWVEPETGAVTNIPRNNLAEYVHLDNGEKEHDHDAMPTPFCLLPLSTWKAIRPDLFTEYRDGQIGPNSVHHRRM